MKVGDKVRYAIGGRMGSEAADWGKSDGLVIGRNYEVVDIDKDRISVAPSMFSLAHDIGHFEPIHPFTQWLTNEIAKTDGSMDAETLQIVLLEFNKHC